MKELSVQCAPYMLEGVTLVVLFENFRGVHVFDWLPGVVAFGVPLPLNEVLELPPSAPPTMVSNALDFILFLIIDKVRRWPREVLSVLRRLFIGHEERCVEGGVHCHRLSTRLNCLSFPHLGIAGIVVTCFVKFLSLALTSCYLVSPFPRSLVLGQR
jgi:hypothetical protein